MLFLPPGAESGGSRVFRTRGAGTGTLRDTPTGDPMSLFSKVAKFAQTPQGRQMINQARRAANDPQNRRKLEGVVRQLRGRKLR